MIENLSKENIEKISIANSRITTIKENKIISSIDEYQKELDDFKKKVDDKNIKETELREDLFKKLWIIDLRYNKNDFEKAEEKETSEGNIDLWFTKNKIGSKEFIIELKLPKKEILKEYRNKPAIVAEIGNAISQLIHYIESRKEKYRIQEGIIIIGREDEGTFIEVFNQYLHGIEIKTYKQIIDNCQKIIDNIKLKPANS